MPGHHIVGFAAIASMLAAAGLPGCSQHAQTAAVQAATPAPAASSYLPALAAPAASEAPMTREKASTDCWMRYEKEGRGLSLDQRLPLVEKCTAEKLRAAGR